MKTATTAPTEDAPVAEQAALPNAGVLKVALPMLGQFLGLSAQHKIVSYKLVADVLEITIEGPDMPARRESGDAEMVNLLNTVATEDGQRVADAYWEHLPGKTWRLR
jgi:hypothetical protein